MLFIDEHGMVQVISMYCIFQMHEDDELTFNANLEEARCYVFLHIEFAFRLCCLILYKFPNG